MADEGRIGDLWDITDESPVGRGKAKLTRAAIHEFCAQILRGNFMYVAGQRLGFTKSQIYNWRDRGAKELAALEAGESDTIGLCGMFVLESDRASADLHDRLIVDVLECEDPKVKWDFMRRRWSKQYSGNPATVEDPNTGESEKIDVAALIVERLEALRESDV